MGRLWGYLRMSFRMPNEDSQITLLAAGLHLPDGIRKAMPRLNVSASPTTAADALARSFFYAMARRSAPGRGQLGLHAVSCWPSRRQ